MHSTHSLHSPFQYHIMIGSIAHIQSIWTITLNAYKRYDQCNDNDYKFSNAILSSAKLEPFSFDPKFVMWLHFLFYFIKVPKTILNYTFPNNTSVVTCLICGLHLYHSSFFCSLHIFYQIYNSNNSLWLIDKCFQFNWYSL